MTVIDQQLSRHFWLREFLFSETAARMGREIIPTPIHVNNLQRLCVDLLQPIRDALDKPLVITSGLRPAWLNLAIGGSISSEHIDGRAADFKVIGMSPYEVTQRITQMPLTWNQLIHEYGRWTHISIAPVGLKPRMDIRTARVEAGRTLYHPGVLPA